MRLPPIYIVRYTSRDAANRQMKSFTVRGCWNKLDASLEGQRLLRAQGEDPDAWWAYGAERASTMTNWRL